MVTRAADKALYAIRGRSRGLAKGRAEESSAKMDDSQMLRLQLSATFDACAEQRLAIAR